MNQRPSFSLSPEKKRSVEQAISARLLECHPSVFCAYLFGSFVHAAQFRDVDIAVFQEEAPGSALEYELKLERELEELIRFPVDVRVLNGAPLSFVQGVIRFGRLLLDRRPNFRAELEGRIRKEYFDFSRFRRQYLSEVTRAPV